MFLKVLGINPVTTYFMSVPFLFSSSVFSSVFASKSPCWFRYGCHHGDHRTGTPDSPWPGSWRWFLWWTPGRNGRTASAVGQRSAPPSCFAEMTEQKGLFSFCFSPEHVQPRPGTTGEMWAPLMKSLMSGEEREERREERGEESGEGWRGGGERRGGEGRRGEEGRVLYRIALQNYKKEYIWFKVFI